ncbi:FtsK/SpoIIIE domain-containing protein [Streptomyces sp. ME02-7008A-1]|uniref:FtsK/SpoIIIE domain-containing protein n=1 Tax=unclassified Streptomyces TaxID=2593676 RepID=UPI0029B63D6D|nr:MULTISPECIES: FtsK/SpoIIIE domain-containing protein [unclassified Streptomyces]MDX3186175.1 FtsK/SpoIIIE domain-containing protein [Streptomyces sp. ME02-7008A-1]MDX3307086.1 FtsK/SpoIIIE domain-containing protein [Streptomyces sp. ME02-7008A]
MTKQSKPDAEEELYAQAAGAIGVLCIAAGILAAIKDKLGLSWGGAVAVAVGALVALGYAAWWTRTRIHAYLHRKRQPAAAPAQEVPGLAPDDGQTDVQAHPELTAALRTAGAIGREEVIRADEVTVGSVETGTVYDFLVPKGRTYLDVQKRLGPVAGMFGVTRLHLKLDRSRDNERRAKLLVLSQPPFTHGFPSPTRQEIETFDGVPIGRDVTGKLVGVPTFDKASLLVGGMTQTGKTTLVNGLITCLLIAYGEFDLYLLDGKMCGLTKFEKIAVRYEASDSPAVMEDMLDELNHRVDSRYKEIQDAIRNRRPQPKFKPVFFVVDEAADFFTDDGTPAGLKQSRQVAEKARTLVSKALESGISVVMLTQRPAQNAIPVMVRDQFLYRMCLYVASEGTAKVALGDTYFETVAPINPALLDSHIQGQGVLFAHGVTTLIRGFFFDDSFIWDVVDGVYARQQKTLVENPESPIKQAIKIMRDKGVEFIPTPDLAPALGIAEDDRTEAGKQLAKLLGVPAHRGTKGVRGYKLEDLTAAALSGS